MTSQSAAGIDVVIEICDDEATVTFASGRGTVTLTGPSLEVHRAIIEADRQLARHHLAADTGG